jgi:hypothetical protein
MLWTCTSNGDLAVVDLGVDGAYLACTMSAHQSLSIERLDATLMDGTMGFGLSDVAGLTGVESPGFFARGPYLYLTYSSPNCGYCSSDGTNWIRKPRSGSVLDGWSAIGGIASTRSCGGQPRTTIQIDGGVYEWIDQWTPSGAPNQTGASVHIEPLLFGRSGELGAFASCP